MSPLWLTGELSVYVTKNVLHDIYESYATIDPHVAEYERTDAARESFTRAVSRVVLPLHQIAANQGFPTWRP
jgi:hypothetical protein